MRWFSSVLTFSNPCFLTISKSVISNSLLIAEISGSLSQLSIFKKVSKNLPHTSVFHHLKR